MFDLIEVLRARRMPVTAGELSAELAVSQRSIYRDIDTLRSLGAPIDGEAGVGYQLRGGFFLPPLAFSPDELDVLILGLGWVRERADPALVRRAESAMAKILTAKSHNAVADGEPPMLVAAASVSRTADPPGVALLREAMRQQHKVAVRYKNGSGVASDRIIWPIAIVYFDEVRVLAAWCEHRSAFRHFRVDRLHVDGVLDERYPGPRRALVKEWRRQDRDWRSLLANPAKP